MAPRERSRLCRSTTKSLLMERDLFPDPIAARLFEHAASHCQILEPHTVGFEKSDIFGCFPARQQVSNQAAERMYRIPVKAQLSVGGYEIAAFGARHIPIVNKDAGCTCHRCSVNLLLLGKVRTDCVDMGARLDPAAIKDRLMRSRRGRYNIRI